MLLMASRLFGGELDSTGRVEVSVACPGFQEAWLNTWNNVTCQSEPGNGCLIRQPADWVLPARLNRRKTAGLPAASGMVTPPGHPAILAVRNRVASGPIGENQKSDYARRGRH